MPWNTSRWKFHRKRSFLWHKDRRAPRFQCGETKSYWIQWTCLFTSQRLNPWTTVGIFWELRTQPQQPTPTCTKWTEFPQAVKDRCWLCHFLYGAQKTKKQQNLMESGCQKQSIAGNSGIVRQPGLMNNAERRAQLSPSRETLNLMKRCNTCNCQQQIDLLCSRSNTDHQLTANWVKIRQNKSTSSDSEVVMFSVFLRGTVPQKLWKACLMLT